MNNRSFIAISIALACLAFLALEIYRFYTPSEFSSAPANIREVLIGTTTVEAEVADTPATRERGLSGRAFLQPDHGMLFVFEREGNWGFWMKDMHVPLDIFWADSSGVITTMAVDVTPETYPRVFYPKTPHARYVLEVNANFAKAHGVAEGARLVIH